MFNRINYDEWTSIVPFISFWLTFGVFLAICARAFFLRKETLHHMEQLPLADDETTQPSPESK